MPEQLVNLKVMKLFSHVEIPLHPIPHLTHFSFDYGPITRPQNHQWTFENRIILILLENSYLNSWTEKTKVFNEYFRPEMEHELSEGALRSMYRQISSQDDKFGIWMKTKAALETIAISVGIKLIVKEQEHRTNRELPCLKSSRKGAWRTRPKPSSRLMTPSDSSSSSETDFLDVERSCVSRPSGIPRVAFRAFSSRSKGINGRDGFRAGQFVEKDVTPPWSPFGRLYRVEAQRHLARVRTGCTPFV